MVKRANSVSHVFVAGLVDVRLYVHGDLNCNCETLCAMFCVVMEIVILGEF